MFDDVLGQLSSGELESALDVVENRAGLVPDVRSDLVLFRMRQVH